MSFLLELEYSNKSFYLLNFFFRILLLFFYLKKKNFADEYLLFQSLFKFDVYPTRSQNKNQNR